MDLHKRLPAMSLEHHKPLKLCQRSERITSSPSLLSWPSSLSLPSWLSSQVPPPQQLSSSTSLLSLLSLPSSPSWPSLPSSPSSPSWPSWEPFGKCELLRAGARSFGEAWAMKTKDVWLRLKCDISAVTLMTSSVVADSSCLQWKKYDVEFNMHHPLRFHGGNRNQFTVTQSHSCQYIPAVRCLLFLLQ